jgi:hypothetical protein
MLPINIGLRHRRHAPVAHVLVDVKEGVGSLLAGVTPPALSDFPRDDSGFAESPKSGLFVCASMSLDARCLDLCSVGAFYLSNETECSTSPSESLLNNSCYALNRHRPEVTSCRPTYHTSRHNTKTQVHVVIFRYRGFIQPQGLSPHFCCAPFPAAHTLNFY